MENNREDAAQLLTRLCRELSRNMPENIDCLKAVDDPDWDKVNGPQDWRHYVTSETAEIWQLLSLESRLSLHYDALVRASYFGW